MGKVLIIDDSADIVTSIVDMLEEAGHNAFYSYNSADGLKLAQEINPDLILCDILMPHVDGFTFLEKVKNNPLTSHIPIIFMSACASKSDIKRGMEIGVFKYLVKPFDIFELQKIIDEVIHKENMYD